MGGLRRYLGELLHELAQRKESKIVEGHLMVGHVHMCISTLPKYAVPNVIGYLKGKSAMSVGDIDRMRLTYGIVTIIMIAVYVVVDRRMESGFETRER